jgi:D-serine deaminase-like pyridoxal phosphate-dependent protein
LSWDLEAIDTPALIADADIVEQNLARMQAAADAAGLHMWPHTKTHKLPFLAERQMALGAEGITVSKLGEAEVMRDAGFTRILLHYPPLGEAKARRLAALVARGAEMRVALDSTEAADTVARAADMAGGSIDILVEIDPGMHRVGRQPGPEVLDLARYVAERPGLRFLGLTSYAGHISAAPDEAGKEGVLQHEIDVLGAERERLERAGLPPAVVSVGGTHHGARMDRLRNATDVRPGTYVYNDRNILAGDSCRPEDLAAAVLVTVVSRNASWAVVDGGSKAFSFDTSPLGGYGLVPGQPELSLDRMNEEHGVLVWPEGAAGPRVGERLRIVPNHICATVNLHDRVFFHRGGLVERVLPVAGRGRMQ